MDTGAEKITGVGWFLYDKEEKLVCLHRRDNHTDNSPNTWDYFGGAVEEGEHEFDAFLRELYEELGIIVDKEQAIVLSQEAGKKMYIVLFSLKRKRELRLDEGAGFAFFSFADAEKLFDLTEEARGHLAKLKEMVFSGKI